MSTLNNFSVMAFFCFCLDPARPFFELPKVLPAINRDAAAFVDIIHTNSGVLGYIDSIGHADFYPNGGLWQPHCCKNDKSYIVLHFSKCQDPPPYHHLDSNLIEFIDEKGNVHYIDLTATVEEIPNPDMPFTRRFDPANVQFWLYSRASMDDYKELLIPEENEVPQERYDDVFTAGRALVVVTHGWMSSGSSKSTQMIKNAFLAEYDLNVIVVHWEKEAAQIDYIESARSTVLVAEIVRQMIVSLAFHYPIVGPYIHLIGHSLGAHIMGLAGRALRDKDNFVVGRVSGLDPARPFFEFPKVLPAINRDAAAFVDIIHTNSGALGYIDSIGHADFYPNGGLWQRHCCKDDKSWSCAHACAYVYYAETVSGTKYNALKCNSYKDFVRGICNGNEMQLMGLPTIPTADGSYYINIENNPTDFLKSVLGYP